LAEPRRFDLHAWPLDRFGARGEALYMLVAGFLTISIAGLAACLLDQPLPFSSLSPTLFAFFSGGL
jgi:hypothetical protein